jgi:hypothetical protein
MTCDCGAAIVRESTRRYRMTTRMSWRAGRARCGMCRVAGAQTITDRQAWDRWPEVVVRVDESS